MKDREEEKIVIEIGGGFADPTMSWCIVPANGGLREDQYLLVLRNGMKVNITATREDIIETLRAAGYVFAFAESKDGAK